MQQNNNLKKKNINSNLDSNANNENEWNDVIESISEIKLIDLSNLSKKDRNKEQEKALEKNTINFDNDLISSSNENIEIVETISINNSNKQENQGQQNIETKNDLIETVDLDVVEEIEKPIERIKTVQEISKEQALQEKQRKREQKEKFKNLSKEEKKKSKERVKYINKLNKPHEGPKTISLKNQENIIELENVKKYYTNGYMVNEILKGINLEIKNGDFVIILGPSGSGKTTLMNIISGLDRASEGIVNVAGNNLITMNDSQLTKFRKDNVGYVFQQYGLLPNLTVKENILIGQQLQEDKNKRKSIDDIVFSLGLAEHINKYPHQLSGGQQQRVSIARAFAKNPTILFGDEPTGAIDEEMSKMVLKEFVKINKEFGTTIIIVTHNPIFADLGNLVIKIKDGNIHQNIRNEKPKSVDELPWGQE